MNLKVIATSLLASFTMISCGVKAQSPDNKEFDNMDNKGFSELIKSADTQLLDVRTLEEYTEGHIKNATLIDVNTDSFITSAEAKLDKKKTVAVYCRSGRRSANAASKLSSKGFKVVNLEGGIIGWTKEGYPVSK